MRGKRRLVRAARHNHGRRQALTVPGGCRHAGKARAVCRRHRTPPPGVAKRGELDRVRQHERHRRRVEVVEVRRRGPLLRPRRDVQAVRQVPTGECGVEAAHLSHEEAAEVGEKRLAHGHCREPSELC